MLQDSCDIIIHFFLIVVCLHVICGQQHITLVVVIIRTIVVWVHAGMSESVRSRKIRERMQLHLLSCVSVKRVAHSEMTKRADAKQHQQKKTIVASNVLLVEEPTCDLTRPLHPHTCSNEMCLLVVWPVALASVVGVVVVVVVVVAVVVVAVATVAVAMVAVVADTAVVAVVAEVFVHSYFGNVVAVLERVTVQDGCEIEKEQERQAVGLHQILPLRRHYSYCYYCRYSHHRLGSCCRNYY